jgi:hypothetical protein
VLGFIGIGQLNDKTAIIDRLYGTIALYSFSYSVGTKLSLPPALEIGRILAPLTVAYAGFRAIAAIFVQQWTEFRVGALFRGHVVVCGLGRTGLRFAITFRELGMQVVAIETTPSATAVEECRKRGIPLLDGDATDPLMLTKAGSLRCRYLIAACGDDGANGDVALQIQAESSKRRRPIDCFVHISDDRLCALLEEAGLLSPSTELIHIEYFNVYRIGPRALLNTHALTVASPPHFLVIGTGGFGVSLVVEAARRWHVRVTQPGGSSFTRNRASVAAAGGSMQITLVGVDAPAQIEKIQAHFPSLAKHCRLVASPSDLSGPDTQTLQFPIQPGTGSESTIAFVCLDDDAAGLRAAIRARRNLEAHVPVVVCTTNRASSVTELLSESGSNLLPNVRSFEVLEKVCTPEILLNGISEAMAQAFHAEYVESELAKGSDPAGDSVKPWDELDETFRRANRGAAFDIGPKLRRINCAVEPMADWDAAVFKFDPDELELLSIMEHDRWCKDRIADGWVYAPVKDVEKKHQPDLVPWEKLTEDVKDKDREAVGLIPAVLATYAGFAIVRRTPPVVPSATALVPAGVEPEQRTRDG